MKCARCGHAKHEHTKHTCDARVLRSETFGSLVVPFYSSCSCRGFAPATEAAVRG